MEVQRLSLAVTLFLFGLNWLTWSYYNLEKTAHHPKKAKVVPQPSADDSSSSGLADLVKIVPFHAVYYNGKRDTERSIESHLPWNFVNRTDPVINFGPENTTFPPVGINPDEFWVVWEGDHKFPDSEFYRFLVTVDNGARLFIDGALVLDKWQQLSQNEVYMHRQRLSRGVHRIRFEYGKFSARAASKWWKPKDSSGKEVASFSDWRAVAASMASLTARLSWSADALGVKIFVYPLPPRYNSEVLEMEARCRTHMFGAEVYIHEQLLSHPVRTMNPWEADYFYVPVYSACKFLPKPYFGVDPWFGSRQVNRAIARVQARYPFWARSEGSDHIFTLPYDYGACFEYKRSKAERRGVNLLLHNSIVLSTLGDRRIPCFHSHKDIAIPTFVDKPAIWRDARGGAGVKSKRDIFAYFRGSLSWFDGDQSYSFGVRQALRDLYQSDPMFFIRHGKSPDYAQELRRSVFCLCPLGFAPWSPRIFESIQVGCIPVIIADTIRLPFDHHLDWRTFSIKVAEADVKAGRLGHILTSLSQDTVRRKQRAIASMWLAMSYPRPRSRAGDALHHILLTLQQRSRRLHDLGSSEKRDWV